VSVVDIKRGELVDPQSMDLGNVIFVTCDRT
jgi:hypothetical protein